MAIGSQHVGARAVGVPGGSLAYAVRLGTTEPVLAVHGVSSQRRLWSWLAAQAPELTIVAPDLRGRADSLAVSGPSSMARHAEDLVAVLDDLGIESVDVCGMSMGGFVAMHLAHAHPDRVKSLVLVDGGFPMKPPGDLTPEQLPEAFADRLARLARSWGSAEEYRDFFVANTAPLLNPADPLLTAYLDHDLAHGLVRLSGKALLSDAADIYFGANPWQDVTAPIRFLHAQWSVGADSEPAYAGEALARYEAASVATRLVEGVDHAGSIMTARGAAATADFIREALA